MITREDKFWFISVSELRMHSYFVLNPREFVSAAPPSEEHLRRLGVNFPYALVPGWPSQGAVLTAAAVALVAGETGTATNLSLQSGCEQAGDASEDSSAPTYRDSKRSMLGKWEGVIENYILSKISLTILHLTGSSCNCFGNNSLQKGRRKKKSQSFSWSSSSGKTKMLCNLSFFFLGSLFWSLFPSSSFCTLFLQSLFLSSCPSSSLVLLVLF